MGFEYNKWLNYREPDINYKYANSHLDRGDYWWNVSSRSDLNMEFVREYQNSINWYALSKNEYFKCDVNFIREFRDKIYWKEFTRYSSSMNEEIARYFIDFIDWSSISYKKYLSDQFIADYADKIKWGILLKYRRVDDEFLEKFVHLINDEGLWDMIAKNQKITTEFVKKHKDKLNYMFLAMNLNFTYYWRKKFKELWKKENKK